MEKQIESNLNSLIQSLRLGENQAIEHLYRKAYPMVEAYILKNSGSRERAQDIFQDALIVMIRKVREPDFKFTAAPTTYLFSIAKNLWYKFLRNQKSRKEDLVMDDETHKILSENEIIQPEEFEFPEVAASPLHQMVAHCFELLGETCKKVIHRRIVLKLSHATIAEELNISEGSSRFKLTNCMKQLRKRFREKRETLKS